MKGEQHRLSPLVSFIADRDFHIFLLWSYNYINFFWLQIKDSLVRELSAFSTSKSTTELKPIFEVILNW